MGSFWGHFSKGSFFAVLGIWWMACAFKDYVQSESKGKRVKPKISYDVTIKGRQIPIEKIFKVIFPIQGIVGELLDGGRISFIDAEGNFAKLVYQQHITVYGMFLIHGLIDLVEWLRYPVYPSLNYLSAVASFTWYGTAFYYHASMHGKEAVETLIHVMPVFLMFIVCITIVLEYWWRQGVWTMIVRAYGVLTIGTWFAHMAFILYVHDKFPGGEASSLDRGDPRNVLYVKAMYGMHLVANLVITLALYSVVYITSKIRHSLHIDAQSLQDSYDQVAYGTLSTETDGFHKPHTGKRQTIADTCVDDGSGVSFLKQTLI